MKLIKKVILLIIVFLIFSFQINTLHANTMIFSRYHRVVVDVHDDEDNRYSVTELHQLDKFITMSHVIPSTYYGKRIVLENVKVNGMECEVEERDGNYIMLVNFNEHSINEGSSFKFEYDMVFGKDSNSDFDQLHFPIKDDGFISTSNVSFKLTMPKSFDHNSVKFLHGDSDREVTHGLDYTIRGNVISGWTDIWSDKVVTISCRLPEGYFSEDETIRYTGDRFRERFPSPTKDFPVFMAYVFSFILAIIIFILWIIYKEKPYPTPVQFYPPPNITPAEAGYIVDGVVDDNDINSLLIDWVYKGYCEIKENEIMIRRSSVYSEFQKEIIMRKIKEPDQSMAPYERELFNDLFHYSAINNEVVITNSDSSKENSVSISYISFHIKTEIKEKYEKNEKLYTRNSMKQRFLFHCLSLIPSFIISFTAIFSGLGEKAIAFEVFFGALFYTAAFHLTIYLILALFLEKQYIKRIGIIKASITRRPYALISSLLLILLRGTQFIIAFDAIMYFTSLDIITIILISIIINTLAYKSLRRTENSRKHAANIMGFYDFLIDAEKPRIEALVKDNPEYFHDILPYLMAFGITQEWVKRFEIFDPASMYEVDTLEQSIVSLVRMTRLLSK